jgi:hypothetical protein
MTRAVSGVMATQAGKKAGQSRGPARCRVVPWRVQGHEGMGLMNVGDNGLPHPARRGSRPRLHRDSQAPNDHPAAPRGSRRRRASIELGAFFMGICRRRLFACVASTAVAVSAGVGLVGSTPAAQALSRAAHPGYQTNGRVTSIVTVGNTVFIGGDFTSVRPSGTAAGAPGVARQHLAALRLDNGRLRAWKPATNGGVSALASSPNGRTLFVGGDFTRLNGSKRHNLGALSTRTGTIRHFKAGTNGQVLAIAATRHRVYLGGMFTRIKGTKRQHLGATDRHGRLLQRWKPRASGPVRSIAMSRNRRSVYVGGDFSAINRHRNQHVAVIGAMSGKVARWRHHPGYAVWDIVVHKKRVYLGGNGVGGRVGAFTRGGRQRWTVQADGGVQAIAYLHGKVIAGGHFYNICVGVSPGSTPGFDCPQVQAHRSHLVALRHKGGRVTAWNPTANSILGVFARPREAGPCSQAATSPESTQRSSRGSPALRDR